MKNLGLLTLLPLFACAHQTPVSNKACETIETKNQTIGRFDNKKIVARWGNKTVSYGQIISKAGGEMRTDKNKFLTSLYEKEMETLNAIVSEELLRKAAAEKSLSYKDYMNELRQSAGEVDTEVVKRFYEANRSRINQDYEVVRGEIAKYLRQEKQKEIITEKLERLYADAKVELLLDEPNLLPFDFDLSNRPSKGAKTPLVTIVEFSDFECPYCRLAANDLERRVKKFGEQVSLVFMHYPLSFHKNAMPAAIASECANQQKAFWSFHDQLFEKQEKLAEVDYSKLAIELGLNSEKFELCLQSPQAQENVRKDMAQGMKAGVRGTPSVFLNGIVSSRGVPSDDELRELIDRAALKLKIQGDN